jgi:hypothetical protein
VLYGEFLVACQIHYLGGILKRGLRVARDADPELTEAARWLVVA